MSIAGDILSADIVEDAVEALLRKWMPTALRNIEDVQSRTAGSLEAPTQYVKVAEFDHFSEDALPAVIIVSPGTTEDPTREGRGRYRARYEVGVGIVVASGTLQAAHKLVRVYAAVIRQILVQNPALDEPWGEGVRWTDESFDEFPVEDRRSIAAGRVGFEVEVSGVVDAMGMLSLDGEPLPTPVAPLPDWPDVETTIVEATIESEIS